MFERFADLEQLLFRGFLLIPTILAPEVSPVPVLFKSMTESEYETINRRYFFIESAEEKFLYYVAYSIAEIEGKNLLPERDADIDELVQIIKSWPSEYFTQVTQIIDHFRERISLAMGQLEAYSYTATSQTKWKCYKNFLLTDPKVTGWEGTQFLKMSSTQETWVLLNALEEERKQYEMLNDMGRLMATATNPEGMKSVNKEEVDRRRQIHEYRKGLLQERNKLDPNSIDFNHPEKFTPQELVEQLKRMRSGELDEHDLIVADYEKNLKQVYLEEKKRKEALLQSHTERNTLPSGVSSLSRAITEEELAERRKAREEQRDQALAKNQSTEHLDMSINTRKKFAAMADLSEEDEAYLHKDLLSNEEPSWGVPEKPVIQAKTFDFYMAQQAAFKKEMGLHKDDN